jgi:hypothetical protein
MDPIRCPETSVKDYHSTLLNIPEQPRSHKHRGGSLQSRAFLLLFPLHAFMRSCLGHEMCYVFIKIKQEGSKLCFCHVMLNEMCHFVPRPEMRYCVYK